MVSRIKEAIIYPIGDPNWLKKIGMWWLYCVLYVTSPALFGHYFAIIDKTIEDFEEEKLPEFDSLWPLWKRGFLNFVVMGMPMFIPAVLNMAAMMTFVLTMGPQEMDGFPTPVLIFFGIHVLLCLGNFILFPAFILQLATSKEYQSVFRFREIAGIINANLGQYLVLVLYPLLAYFAMLLVALTGVGLVLWLPGLPILFFAHARLVGLYARTNLVD